MTAIAIDADTTEPTYTVKPVTEVPVAYRTCCVCGDTHPSEVVIHPKSARTCVAHKGADKRRLEAEVDWRLHASHTTETVSLEDIPEDIRERYDLKPGMVLPFSGNLRIA